VCMPEWVMSDRCVQGSAHTQSQHQQHPRAQHSTPCIATGMHVPIVSYWLHAPFLQDRVFCMPGCKWVAPDPAQQLPVYCDPSTPERQTCLIMCGTAVHTSQRHNIVATNAPLLLSSPPLLLPCMLHPLRLDLSPATATATVQPATHHNHAAGHRCG
jgi:hypothetical protein